MSVTPCGGAVPPRTFAVDVVGTVLSRISIHGAKIDSQKVLRFGMLRKGEGARERLIMKVRDDHRQLAIRQVETRPDFLQVHVAPYSREAEQLGLYTIDVEVPGNAPMGNFLVEKGAVRIQTDHPAVPVLELEVAFAVSGG
jgi:hypothetical protein